MATQAENYLANLDINNTLRQWARLSNDTVMKTLQIAEPVAQAYLKSLSGTAGELEKAYQRACQIPETDCPDYCVCELSWEACAGDEVSGTIDIRNTGNDTSRFVLNGEEFNSDCSQTSVKPILKPADFVLKPGESQRVTVMVRLDDSMEPETTYRSEIKLAGRYEQCIKLALQLRRKSQPCCRIEHGEIPTRIVAHHWYDHFQCEELCFAPVRHPEQSTRPAAKKTTGRKTRTTNKRG